MSLQRRNHAAVNRRLCWAVRLVEVNLGLVLLGLGGDIVAPQSFGYWIEESLSVKVLLRLQLFTIDRVKYFVVVVHHRLYHRMAIFAGLEDVLMVLKVRHWRLVLGLGVHR